MHHIGVGKKEKRMPGKVLPLQADVSRINIVRGGRKLAITDHDGLPSAFMERTPGHFLTAD